MLGGADVGTLPATFVVAVPEAEAARLVAEQLPLSLPGGDAPPPTGGGFQFVTGRSTAGPLSPSVPPPPGTRATDGGGGHNPSAQPPKSALSVGRKGSKGRKKGVRIDESGNTVAFTHAKSEYVRVGDFDPMRSMMEWDLEEEAEKLRMLEDRWTYMESLLPPLVTKCDERIAYETKHAAELKRKREEEARKAKEKELRRAAFLEARRRKRAERCGVRGPPPTLCSPLTPPRPSNSGKVSILDSVGAAPARAAPPPPSGGAAAAPARVDLASLASGAGALDMDC